MSMIRRRLGAAVVAAAALGAGAATTVPSAEAATTAEFQQITLEGHQTGSNQGVVGLAVVALGTSSGSPVLLGPSNVTGDRLGQWQKAFTGQFDVSSGRALFNYRVRKSVEFGNPVCLDVKDDSTATDAKIVVRPCDGTASQAWFDSPRGGDPVNGLTIKNENSKRLLTNARTTSAFNTPLIQTFTQTTWNQHKAPGQ